MDEKKLYLSEDMEDDALIAEIDEALEAVEETVDDATLAEELRADIRLLKEKEKLVAQKLSLAKSKGLSPQVDQCRALLQKVVAHRQKKQEELKVVEERLREAEAKKFAAEFSEEIAKEILLEKEIEILINLGDGKYGASAWGCDLTYDYVKINGDYRT